MQNFPAVSKFAGKLFQQRISDRHSLLEFSELRNILDDTCVTLPKKQKTKTSTNELRNTIATSIARYLKSIAASFLLFVERCVCVCDCQVLARDILSRDLGRHRVVFLKGRYHCSQIHHRLFFFVGRNFGSNAGGRRSISLNWSRESAGVARYGCIPQSAANNLGEIPLKIGAPDPSARRVMLERNTLGPGLAIYAARGCRAELWKLPQWFLPLRWPATFFSNNEIWKLDIFQVASNEFGGGSRVQKKSVSMRKLILRELSAENCVN